MTRAVAAAPAPVEFDALMAAHRGAVLKVAASYCRSREDRADLAQEIALQLWRAWPAYDTSRPFMTWMYRIALNVAISHRRASERRGSDEALGSQHETLVGDADVDAESSQQLALVERAMRTLGAYDRALLLLHLEGCSHRETGDVLGIAEGNVATRLGRIRQHLRRIAGEPANGVNNGGNA